jgi:gluconolactonase
LGSAIFMKKSLSTLATATVLFALACSVPSTSIAQSEVPPGSIDRLDPALDGLIPQGAQLEKVAGGFIFTEGPVWRPSMGLWFSDVIGDVVRQWSPDGKVIEILHPMGFAPEMRAGRGLIGPNAMVADQDGALLLCEHANRRIVRITKDMLISVLVDRYQGKRLNSPNDLVYRSDGSLYFTDPPYGLPKEDNDPAKELPFNGVFRLSHGKLQLVVKDMTRPNGIAFSPDQKTLYISNSDPARKIWMMYDVAPDGTVRNGRLMADATASKDSGNPDGMKLDIQGNIYGAGPGGLWIFSGAGKHLGTIRTPEVVSNCAWGDDGKTLYITARTSVYKIKLSVPGQKVLYEPDFQ